MSAARTPAPIAVVIPTFNHAHFLADAIDSVLSQTVSPAEILVVDDGSADHPERVVAAYPEVTIVHQQNHGLAAARNFGWRRTHSPYICFLDADDRLEPHALALGLDLLERHPAAGFGYGAYANFYWPSLRTVDIPFQEVAADAFRGFLATNPIGMHGAVLYRRGSLEAVNGFSEELSACEDYDLYLRLSCRYPVACRQERFAMYRQHGTNMVRDKAFILRSVLRVMRRFKDKARERGLLRDYRAGVRRWKLFYLDSWSSDIVEHGVSLAALRQGFSLMIQAPGTTVHKLSRALVKRLAHGGGR